MHAPRAPATLTLPSLSLWSVLHKRRARGQGDGGVHHTRPVSHPAPPHTHDAHTNPPRHRPPPPPPPHSSVVLSALSSSPFVTVWSPPPRGRCVFSITKLTYATTKTGVPNLSVSPTPQNTRVQGYTALPLGRTTLYGFTRLYSRFFS